MQETEVKLAIVKTMELLCKFLENEEALLEQERVRHKIALAQGVSPLMKRLKELLFTLGQVPGESV